MPNVTFSMLGYDTKVVVDGVSDLFHTEDDAIEWAEAQLLARFACFPSQARSLVRSALPTW